MKNKISIPKAPQKLKNLELHGDIRVDPFFWLREKENPETLKYLNAENAYYEAHMKPLASLKDKLFKEMKARIKEDDSSVPAPYGEYLYYTRYKKGKQYSYECRKLKAGGKEQILLDKNVLAKGKKYCDVTSVKVSPEHDLLSYCADFDGSERYTVYFKDLTTNKLLKDTIPNCNGAVAFAEDNETVFYVRLDENLRPYQVYRHKLGNPVEQDELVYHEKDAKQFLGLSKSASHNFIFIGSYGKITSEVWYLDAHNPSLPARCIQPRIEGLEYDVDHAGDKFWIRTNLEAQNFKIMTTSLLATEKDHWKDFVPHKPEIFVGEFHLFKNFLVLGERENGLPQVRIFDLQKKKDHTIKFKDAAFNVSITPDNYEYKTENLRLNYSSPITVPTILEYNMRTKATKTLKTKQVKGHKSTNYVCERVWVTGHDGTQIPMVLTYKKGLKKNKTNPTYLYGYGSYGAIIPDSFPERRDIFRLVDRGCVFAMAHIRGGGEMGRQWYEDAKFLKKTNTFKDFISCAEYLKYKGYSHPQKLAIAGGSAGGMLMGACMNMRPDLFDVVVAHVPFVDVVNTMLDKDLPLTQTEYKEWGNPEDREYYFYMKSYSPYDNIEEKNYPTLYVTCGLNDPRVTYWEPAKWVAKLRDKKTDDNLIIFKTNMGAGHFGSSGRFDHLYENAEEYAFVLNHFGIKK
ncbi:S9 family peptidase [Bdellovibrio sp. HCB117]|uniref:S9 family peptidase n=1 Tax=Bdellovibrio sp. HCB117 TaxID=3394359 RepID=UPI0039B3BD59